MYGFTASSIPSRSDHLTPVGVVDRRDLDLLLGDVLPDVELGPVRDREHPHVLALAMPAVEDVPQLGPLVLRVPLAVLVAEREDPLLGPGLLLVSPAAAEHRVEAALRDAPQQGDGLQPVAARLRPGLLGRPGRRRCRPARWRRRGCRLSSATRWSRYSITSGKLWPVSTCITGKGIRAGWNAFWAIRNITIESLPPENSSTGRSNSAATSRMMWIDSASSTRRWVSS